MKEHKKYIDRAIELARKSMNSGGGPFGAVVVRSGEIVSEGMNRVVADRNPTAHAEIMAIEEACRVLGTHSLEGCIIYSSCEPCPMCLGAIYWSRLDAVYFSATHRDAGNASFDDSFIYSELNKPCDQRSLPCIRIPAEKAVTVFDDWKSSEKKIPY